MAKRFVFKLQPVLDQREAIEQEHQRRVAAFERQRLDLEARLRQIQEQVDLAKGDLRTRLEPGCGPVVVQDVRLQAGASIALLARAQGTAIELAGVLKRLDVARAELLKATAARKAVQLLKDRRFEQWRTALEKADVAATDEIATGAFVRMRMAGSDENQN